MTTKFSNCRTQTIAWNNEHGTFARRNVTRILPVAAAGDGRERWRRVGDVLREVVAHAFRNGAPLRVDGSRWSLSKIGVPDKLALSLAAHDVLQRVPTSWVSQRYRNSLAGDNLTPMLISGSMKIGRINRLLGLSDLALQTSGASNGQTLAGATATGTHGAAIGLGAMHDTVRAVHLMVSPTKTVLVQPSSRPLRQSAAQSLTAWLGLATQVISDDAVFNAALVHLGSMGIVLNMIVEVEPLYFLTRVTTPHVGDEWMEVLANASCAGVPKHPRKPFHLEVVFSPYSQRPRRLPRAWVRSMSKTLFRDQPGVRTDPSHSAGTSPDLLAFLSTLGDLVNLPIRFRRQITKQLVNRYGVDPKSFSALPGAMFGPTSIPRGQGHSIEFAVDARNARAAAEALMRSLNQSAKAGRQFLGAVGARFVGGSRATLAPNTNSPTCFFELPCIRTSETKRIYEACGAALTAHGIAFGCHWGQYLTSTKRSLRSYWTRDQKLAWLAARKRLLLTQRAHEVFASPILKAAGLS